MPDKVTSVEQAVPIGKLFSNVTVSRVIPEWGLVCRTEDGLEGFVHVRSYSSQVESNLNSSYTDKPHLQRSHKYPVIWNKRV